jgi:hypothetical protein
MVELKQELQALITDILPKLMTALDNNATMIHDLETKDMEIQRLKHELEVLKADKLNFNNVSLIRQQDKIVNELQREIIMLKHTIKTHTKSNTTDTNVVGASVVGANTNVKLDIDVKPKKKKIKSAIINVVDSTTES